MLATQFEGPFARAAGMSGAANADRMSEIATSMATSERCSLPNPLNMRDCFPELVAEFGQQGRNLRKSANILLMLPAGRTGLDANQSAVERVGPDTIP